MSMQCSPDGISDEDRRVFRLFKILASEGRRLFYYVFQKTCKKEPTESVKEYLMKKGMQKNFYTSKFDKVMRQKIDSDPLGQSYDISLLFACLRWACDLTTNSAEWEEGKENMESLLTKAKNMRNRLLHGEEVGSDENMIKMSSNIIEVFEKIMKSVITKHNISDDEGEIILKDIIKRISKIMKAPLDSEGSAATLSKFKEEQKNAIRDIGIQELKEYYKYTSKIDPASFVTGKERLHVQNVFTKLEVVCENQEGIYEVGYKDLLDVKTECGEQPSVIIVEGDAGAGKTTLTKLIVADWVEGCITFEGLDQYELVFRVEGKKHISSYLELIQSLLPIASYRYDDNDLVRYIQQLKVMLIMDGFDELNTESEKLIRELSDQHIRQSNGRLQLLITTRPSKLSDLCCNLDKHSRIQSRLRGISASKRVDFVTKLHNEMIKEKMSSQDTQKLVDLLKQSQVRLGEHYRLPLNLTLLTYLWASDPSNVNLETTATSLYIAFQRMIESRLLTRLQEKLGVVKMPNDKCQEIIRKFKEKIYSVCLETLRTDSMQLSSTSEETLKEKCEKLQVPFSDMVEAFLVVEKEWTCSGYKTELTLPHKSILEFYAANEFLTYIKARNNEEIDKEFMADWKKFGLQECNIHEMLQIPEDKKSLKTICKDLLQTDQNLDKYENLFLHLTGLLAHQCPDTLCNYAQELIQILHDAEFKGTKWLDLLVEAECDETMAGLLGQLNNLQLKICDGHMAAALTMFKYLETNTPVQVILENEVTYIPHLDDMLNQLSARNCAVDIYFKHQWKNYDCGSSDGYLSSLLLGKDNNQRCKVTRFTGLLETLVNLPETVTNLKIAFTSTEHAQKLLKELNQLVKHQEISDIGIHVMHPVMSDGLSPLPIIKPQKGGECGTLWLSQVGDDWQDKCKVIDKLLPHGGMFHSIMFPQSKFSAKQCTDILAHLKDLNIKVNAKGGIHFSYNAIIKHNLAELKNICRLDLGCTLYCSDDSSMW